MVPIPAETDSPTPAEGSPCADSRIARRFAALKAQNRAAFVPFITAGDPAQETTAALLDALPRAGADLIELGVPFTDPMADGPAIQEASLRALKAGASLAGTLDLVRGFRRGDGDTPIVLMGYLNPIHAYGPERFLADAKAAEVDGLIVVDAPPEEDDALCRPARRAGIDWIRLATPTTDGARLPAVLTNASGFLYYVSVTGVTGAASADAGALEAAVDRIKAQTDLPIGIGFGITSPAQAAAAARLGDAVVVGSALVRLVADHLDGDGRPKADLVPAVTDAVARLADATHGARR